MSRNLPPPFNIFHNLAHLARVGYRYVMSIEKRRKNTAHKSDLLHSLSGFFEASEAISTFMRDVTEQYFQREVDEDRIASIEKMLREGKAEVEHVQNMVQRLLVGYSGDDCGLMRWLMARQTTVNERQRTIIESSSA